MSSFVECEDESDEENIDFFIWWHMRAQEVVLDV
jgi:hypothetical protein